MKRKSEKVQFPDKIKKSKLINEEINELNEQKAKTTKEELLTKISFDELPLSSHTKLGLKQSYYHQMTPIQQQTLPLAIYGEDIMGAAQTGSGKTIAFLVPVLELLFMYKWSRYDGVGAIIITPTRELALQIFETLSKIAIHHDFVAGLIIGGKDLKFEWSRMHQCNIVICTPGRLLHHLDQNPVFECSSLKILVLDEADRILELGFANDMNAILEHLPKQRQTLLFSATQRKSVKDLARLSLTRPKYVSVDEKSEFSTPPQLKQFYLTCDLERKIEVLWTFIVRHKKQKIIVFFSSCKQVKFLAEAFKKLRSGTTILPLYGRLHQLKRMEVYEEFCKKSRAILFATDLAARGLDFPKVNWVIQFDCPEDSKTYIHRVGRTARYFEKGESLLLLMPSEKDMLLDLEKNKVPISQMRFSENKIIKIAHKMSLVVTKNDELTASGNRALVGYLKTNVRMKNKKNFDFNTINVFSFAASLGLRSVPKLRFLNRFIKNGKFETENAVSDDFLSEDEDDKNKIKETKPLTRIAQAKKSLKTIAKPTKIVFNDDDDNNKEPVKSTVASLQAEMLQKMLSTGDKSDREIINERRFEKKVKLKEKLRKELSEENSKFEEYDQEEEDEEEGEEDICDD